MPKKTMKQLSMTDYELKEVHVRLCLKEGSTYYSQEAIDNPMSAIRIMRDIMTDLDRETAIVVNLDNKRRPLNFNIVSIGDVNQALVPIQNIFKSAILSNATSILLLHNHPSGDPTPSREDFQITYRVAEVGKLMGITLIDHVIVGAMAGHIYSIRENKPEIFDNNIDMKLIQSIIKEERKDDYMKEEFMNFEEFVQTSRDQIKDFLPEEFEHATIRIDKVNKLDDSYTGLSVALPDQIGGPIVNLNMIYEDYQKTMDLHTVFQQMASIIKDHPMEMDLSYLTDYEQIKDKLFVRVSNQNNLGDKLSTVPHQNMEDLVVTYHIRIDTNANGIVSAMVTNAMLESYGISKEELQKDAILSAEKLMPLRMDTMQNILMLPEEMDTADKKMLIITTAEGTYGASAFFYPDTIEKAEKIFGGDFIMLPSSVHEVILVPHTDGDLKDMEQIVREINQTQVSPKDQLSNHLYHYDAKEKLFERADRYEERMKAKEATRSVLDKLQNVRKQIATTTTDHRQSKVHTQEL